MKIGLIPPKVLTGQKRYFEYLMEGLKNEGVDVVVLEGIFYKRPNIKVSLGSIILNKLLKKLEISIVHNIDSLGPFFIKQDDIQIRTVLTVHDIAPIVLPSFHNWITKFDFQYMLPKLVKNSDAIIVPTYLTKKDITTILGAKEDKIHVIHHGVDTTRFYPRSSEEIWNVLRKYKIPQPYILYVGTDKPRKNLKTLLSAFKLVSNDILHSLVLIGPINKNIIQETFNWGFKKIILPGYIDDKDIPAIYSGADIFIFPSLYEGFGFPVLEAMACGVPVVLSKNSSLPELAGHTGVYIKNPMDPVEIAEKIYMLIENSDLRKKLKKEGLSQTKKFRWEESIKKTIKVYEQLI